MSSRNAVVEVMDPMVVEIMRKKRPEERLAISFGMWESARVMIRGTLQQNYPDWSEEQVNQELVRRISHGEVGDVGT